MMFIVEKEYTKNDIYSLLKVPVESQKGSWDTGYRSYGGEIFIFTNVGVAGRTGVNHGNFWQDENLVWFGKSTSHSQQNLIKMMISNETNVHIFFRDDAIKGFTYKGLGKALKCEGSNPIKIIWTFIDPDKTPSEQIQAIEGIDDIHKSLTEGNSKRVEVSVYKRCLEARQKCIELKGCFCSVCGFNFEKNYGSIGQGFIHIHHINQLSETNDERIVNPETDLLPVCPNCHSMLHKRKPAFSVEELKLLLR